MLTTHRTAHLPIRKILVTGFLVASACTAFTTTTAQAAPLTLPDIGTIDIPAGPTLPPLGAPEATTPAGTPDASSPPSADSSPEQHALTYAEGKLGAPYVWGASGPDTFDCSGLMQWAYQQVGIDIPRTSQAQETSGERVALDALQPGDLVFFSNGEHVGMYTGDGTVIHAPTSGDHVKFTPVSAMTANTARRY
ncbi:C40 family peptidase [Rhodococcus erythropolis]|uniref:C40 family peptidase n=1 Tax=Rhodococcus erythropolis TaxID=1833 RepID=UPI00294A69DC|nr:C40 family peptidase [Rhodococcus erythropolis]MDV6278822.1 C40 family peptidase [Rhodococcus erythropolis]